MKKQKKRKTLFCPHPCFEDEKHYGRYRGSYVYQCSLCGAYIGCIGDLGVSCEISEKAYRYFIEKGNENGNDREAGRADRGGESVL